MRQRTPRTLWQSMGVDVNPYEPAGTRRPTNPLEQSFIDSFIRVELGLELTLRERTNMPLNPSRCGAVPIHEARIRPKVKQSPANRVNRPLSRRLTRCRPECPIREQQISVRRTSCRNTHGCVSLNEVAWRLSILRIAVRDGFMP